jgi:hypothetical protein
MMQSMLVDSLIERLFAAEANKKVADLLRSIRDDHGLTSQQLRITGSEEELKAALRQAITIGALPVNDLAAHVDAVEENGNQHIFIFDMTAGGVAELTPQRARGQRISATTPTENAYDAYPGDRLTWHVDRLNRLVLKQIHTASFWRKNDQESTRTEEREVLIYDRVRRRAINMLVIDSSRRRAEIRVSRVEGSLESDRKAVERLAEFVSRVAPFLKLEEHLTPTPIWNAFFAIATNREEVVMHWDRAAEARLSVTLSDRMLGRGGDVRDHPDYRLHGQKWARKELRVSWLRGSGEDSEEIAVKLSEVKYEDVPIGKVEFYKPTDPESLNYVIGRIRHFTAEASGGS